MELVRGQMVNCVAQPDKRVKRYPALKSNRPLYGTAQFGGLPGSQSDLGFRFVFDEASGPGKGYDRLYFDLNRDLDLTNDAAVEPMKDPPAGANLSQWKEKQIVFDYLPVPFDYGPGLGVRPFRILPNGSFHSIRW